MPLPCFHLGRAGPGSCFCPPTSLRCPLDKAAGTSPLPLTRPPARQALDYLLLCPSPVLCVLGTSISGGLSGAPPGPLSWVLWFAALSPHTRGVPPPSPPRRPPVFSPSSLSSRPLPGLETERRGSDYLMSPHNADGQLKYPSVFQGCPSQDLSCHLHDWVTRTDVYLSDKREFQQPLWLPK